MKSLIHASLVFVVGLALAASPDTGVGRPQDADSISGQAAVPVLWREPTDIEHRDLFYGIGGKENEPDPTTVYKFMHKTKLGSQPKMIVGDEKGRVWILKTGPEARPETTSTRILWAAGYYVDQDYFLPSVRILDETITVQTDLRFERLEGEESDLGHWSWKSNPFLGTRELDGLKVLIALLRDVDVKNDNNQIRRITDNGVPTNVYYISDLGSTLGSTGTALNKIPFFRNLPADHFDHSAPKADAGKFAKGTLIRKVDSDKVVFSSKRASLTSLLRGISVDNARWMGNILSQLSDAQLSDAFRAGGFDDEETQVFVSTLRNRIDDLRNLTPEEK